MLRSSLHVAIATRQFNRFFHRSAVLKSGDIRVLVNRSPTQRRCSRERISQGLSHKNYIDDTWIDLLDEMHDPKTRELIQRLDFSSPLGVDPKHKKDVAYLKFFQDKKRSHPDKLILARHGDVYEAIGIDAVMIVHFTSQPCSGNGVPMIKCSPMNLDYLLSKLTRKLGFVVVICEESSYKQGKIQSYKKWYIAEIIGGAYKQWYFNSKDPDETINLDLAQEALPIAAVYWSQTGYSLLQYFTEKNTLKITSRMSEEALWAKLNSTGITTPLYLHRSSIPGSELDSTMKQWKLQAERIAKNVFGSIEYYPASDPVLGFKNLLHNKNPTIHIEDIVEMSEDVKDRTSPPPLSTVSEIGLQPREGSGVLPLLDYLIPERTPKLLSSWIQQCVLDPPPIEIATNIQNIVRELMILQCSLPRCKARLTPSRLVDVFELEKVDLDVVIELRASLEQLVEFLSEKEVSALAQSLLYIVHHETNVPLTLEDLLENCQAAIDEISKVVLHPTDQETLEYPPDTLEEMQPFFECIRDPLFNSINPKAVQQELEKLQKAERNLNQAAKEIKEETQSLGVFKSFLIDSETSRIRVISRKRGQSLPNCFLSRYKDNKEQLTTEEFDHVQEVYFAAYNEWNEKVQKCFKTLRKRLQKQLRYLIAASHASIILGALTAHVIAAQPHQWCLPDITALVKKQSGYLEISGFWPYWMKKESSQLNSISLKGMVVLTGPNMAGKTTILRSVATVCSLAVAGFCVPAESAKVPFIDCVNLKTLVTDSPLEHLSAFGVEMTEMSHVLNDATPSTVLFIDELGKGTEVNGGTALSAAMLKEFCHRGCIGIFATHLHAIKEFEEEYPGVEYMQMEVNEDDKSIPTWKMIPGFSEESFGLNVAREQGIDLHIIDRAEELIRSLDGEDK